MTQKSKEIDEKTILNSIVDGIQEVKGKQIVIVNLTKLQDSPSVYFVICQGDSSTQVSAITHSVKQWLRDKLRLKTAAIDGLENCQWVAMDYGRIIVHIFQRATREFYDLENLWFNAELTHIEDLD